MEDQADSSVQRYQQMDEDHSRLVRMLDETDQLDRRFFTDEQRSAIIDELVEMNDQNSDKHTLKELLKYGCKGFTYFTDLELVTDVFSSYGYCEVDDSEFDGYGDYPIVESGVKSAIKALLTEVTESNLLKIKE